jgi:hypothetical protein
MPAIICREYITTTIISLTHGIKSKKNVSLSIEMPAQIHVSDIPKHTALNIIHVEI